MKTLFLIAFLSCTLLVLKAQNLKKMGTTQDSTVIAQALEDYYFNVWHGFNFYARTAYQAALAVILTLSSKSL